MKHDIKGLNLNIDFSIQEICEASNNTSGSTRSVLYIMVLVTILSLVSVINTNFWSWSRKRTDYMKTELAQKNDSFYFLKGKIRLFSFKDSVQLRDRTLECQKSLDLAKRVIADNFQIVKVPI